MNRLFFFYVHIPVKGAAWRHLLKLMGPSSSHTVTILKIVHSPWFKYPACLFSCYLVPYCSARPFICPDFFANSCSLNRVNLKGEKHKACFAGADNIEEIITAFTYDFVQHNLLQSMLKICRESICAWLGWVLWTIFLTRSSADLSWHECTAYTFKAFQLCAGNSCLSQL